MAVPARILSIAAWCVVAAVLLRVVSGGGTLRGVGHVLGTEPPLVVALIGASLIVASVSIVAQIRNVSWASPFSWISAAIALATSLVLDRGGHESAIVAAAASGLVLVADLSRSRTSLVRRRS
jgi:hypothetical protein